MTNSLLQKVEDKVMHLLAEIELLRKEITDLIKENATLRTEQATHNKKLQGLIALLEMVDLSEHPVYVANDLPTMKGQEAHC